MHFIVGSALLVGFIWFVCGERAARTVVGLGLGAMALLTLVFVGTMMYVVHRDSADYHAGRTRMAGCVKLANAMPLAGNCR